MELVNITSILQLVLVLAVLIGVNYMLRTAWTCRYCGKQNDTGILFGMLNDWFGISICKHEGLN